MRQNQPIRLTPVERQLLLGFVAEILTDLPSADMRMTAVLTAYGRIEAAIR